VATITSTISEYITPPSSPYPSPVSCNQQLVTIPKCLLKLNRDAIPHPAQVNSKAEVPATKKTISTQRKKDILQAYYIILPDIRIRLSSQIKKHPLNLQFNECF